MWIKKICACKNLKMTEIKNENMLHRPLEKFKSIFNESTYSLMSTVDKKMKKQTIKIDWFVLNNYKPLGKHMSAQLQ